MVRRIVLSSSRIDMWLSHFNAGAVPFTLLMKVAYHSAPSSYHLLAYVLIPLAIIGLNTREIEDVVGRYVSASVT